MLFSRTVIHMDINRTIIATDTTQKYTLSDFASLCLAKETEYTWDNIQEPINYYLHVYKNLLPGSRSDKELRKQRRDMIHSFMGNALISSAYPYKLELLARYRSLLKALKSDAKVFTSFYTLLDQLPEDACIVFRTFGQDGEIVLEELGLQHTPRFSRKGELLFREGNEVSYEEFFKTIDSERFVFLQDDFFYWNAHKEAARYGKPLPFRSNDTTIFFDDNVEDSDTTNIVYPFTYPEGEPLKISDLVKAGRIVRVNTVEAILTPQYFVETLARILPQHAGSDDSSQ